MAKGNFAALWSRLVNVAEGSGDSRLKAALMNHEGKKEHICRRMGVVTEADVRRIEASSKRRSE